MYLIREGLLVEEYDRFVIEASEVGLERGEWPELVGVVTPDGDQGRTFRAAYTAERGEVHVYVADDGQQLHILND